jgi:YVTN family beta-propeller protein
MRFARYGGVVGRKAGLALALPALGCAGAAAPQPVAALARPVTAYVASFSQGTVTAVGTGSGMVGRPIELAKAQPGFAPVGMAITPDGKTLYLAGHRAVIAVRTATRAVSRPIMLTRHGGFIAMAPDGKTAYVANLDAGMLTPISTATGTAGRPLAIGGRPDAIAFTPDSTTAYVTTPTDVVPVRTATNTPLTPIAIAGSPQAIAITPDGKTAYVGDYPQGTVTPISTATRTAGTPIPLGKNPSGIYPETIAITPDGKTAYIAIQYPHQGSMASAIVPINTATGTAGARINVPARGYLLLAITPNGRTIYAVGRGAGHEVIAISTATNTIIKKILVRNESDAIAITPDGKTICLISVVWNTLTLISTATRTAGRPIKIGRNPDSVIVFTP